MLWKPGKVFYNCKPTKRFHLSQNPRDFKGPSYHPWFIWINREREAMLRLSDEQIILADQIKMEQLLLKTSYHRDATRLFGDKTLEKGRGAKGEVAFSTLLGLPLDRSILLGGNGGINFVFYENGKRVTIDTTAYRLPWNMLVRTNDIADIFVLMGLSADGKSVLFRGWDTRENMMKERVGVFNKGLNYPDHSKWAARSFNISDLAVRVANRDVV